MKKLKGLMSVAVVLLATIMLAACGGTSYTQLQVNHTQNLEFLIGEDYKDDQLKATATLSDDTTEDVTSKITIDTSEYNKNAVGKYKIYFKLDDIKVNCEVSVVDKITATSTINARFAEVINTSFGTGAYSFEMSSTGTYNSLPFTQTMKHSVTATGDITSYVEWSFISAGTEYIAFEGWYTGTATTGTFTYRRDNAPDADVYSQQSTFAEFNSHIETLATQMGFAANNMLVLIPGSIDALKTATPAITGELTKDGNVYTLVSGDSSFVYENNTLTSIDGIGITFNQAVIPTIPQATVLN